MRISVIATVLTAFLLTACGGGGAAGSGPVISVPPPVPVGGKTAARITFLIPASAASAAKRRNTIPSSTQSIVLNFGGPAGAPLSPTVAAVTINISACTPVSGGYQCSTTVTLPYGAIVASIAAYAGTNGTGALLATGTLSLTVAATGTTAQAVTLSTSSNYGFFGGLASLATLSIDHVGNTFTVNETTPSGGPATISGTTSALPNGDGMGKITSTSGTTSSAFGDLILYRELANGAIALEDSGVTSPPTPWSGATGTSGGAALGIANPTCPTTPEQFAFNVISTSGPSFVSSGSGASEAFLVGSGTASSTTLTGSGTAYDINGNSLGATTSGTLTCSNGGYYPAAGTQGPSLASNALGMIVGLSSNSLGTSPSIVGLMGVANPQSVNLALVLAGTYDGFVTTGGSGTSEGAQPVTATPTSGGLLACPYTNIVTGVPASGTSCFPVTLTSQPYPGIIFGASTLNAEAIVATVGQVNGKYVIFGIVNTATSTTPGFAGNFMLFQH